MSLTTEQKATKEYKAGLGVADTNTNKRFFEELPGGRNTFGSKIWVEDSLIPNEAPLLGNGESSGVVRRYIDLQLVPVPGSPDSFYHENLKDVIPFNWGNGSYVYTIKNSLGSVLPSGYNDVEVDSVAGVVRFYGGAPSNTPPSISFYKYIGAKGVSGGGGSAYYVQDFLNQTSIEVVHNLNRIPRVSLYNLNGDEVVGVVNIDGANPTTTLHVLFNIPVSGKVVCS